MAIFKDARVPLDFYGWFSLFYVVFLGISIYLWFSQWNFIFWFWIFHPAIWLIFYVILSYKYNIFIRFSYIIGIPSLISFFIIDLFLYQYNNSALTLLLIPITLTSMLIFFGFSLLGFAIGFLIAKIITKETKLDDATIQNNSINFLLTGDEEHKKAILKMLFKMIQDNLKLPFFIRYKKYAIFGKNNQFSVKYLLVVFDDNKISIFPYIKDGFYVEPNPKPIPMLSIIGETILRLGTTKDNATTLIESYNNSTQTSKILRMIKNVPHRKIIIAGIILLVAILIITILTHPEYFPINKTDLFTGFFLFILGAGFTAISGWVWKKIKK